MLTFRTQNWDFTKNPLGFDGFDQPKIGSSPINPCDLNMKDGALTFAQTCLICMIQPGSPSNRSMEKSRPIIRGLYNHIKNNIWQKKKMTDIECKWRNFQPLEYGKLFTQVSNRRFQAGLILRGKSQLQTSNNMIYIYIHTYCI
jgi:hypothetical protein